MGSSRYELLVKIASGGMATVYVGRLTASAGFSRLVAIKRAHPHLIDDPTARLMLIEEAALASRIHHANVVAIQDVEHADDELLLVMDYVEGGSLSELRTAALARSIELPIRIGVRIALDACAGLHAVHELAGDDGRPQGLVHRDVSPQNILVGLDGTSRLSDFGIAKIAEGAGATSEGILKGKPAYLAPEYIRGGQYTRRSDLFSLGVVVWEVLTGKSLFRGSNDAETLMGVVGKEAPPPSSRATVLGPEIDAIVGQALEKMPELRQGSVLDFADALEAAARRLDLLATHAEVGTLVRGLLGAKLEQRRELLRAWQAGTGTGLTPVSTWRRPPAAAEASAEAPASQGAADEAARESAGEGTKREGLKRPAALGRAPMPFEPTLVMAGEGDAMSTRTPIAPMPVSSSAPTPVSGIARAEPLVEAGRRPDGERSKALSPSSTESPFATDASPESASSARQASRVTRARRAVGIGVSVLTVGLLAWVLQSRGAAPRGTSATRAAQGAADPLRGESIAPSAAVAPPVLDPAPAAWDAGIPDDPPSGSANGGKAAGTEKPPAGATGTTSKKQGTVRPKTPAVEMPSNPYKSRIKPNN